MSKAFTLRIISFIIIAVLCSGCGAYKLGTSSSQDGSNSPSKESNIQSSRSSDGDKSSSVPTEVSSAYLKGNSITFKEVAYNLYMQDQQIDKSNAEAISDVLLGLNCISDLQFIVMKQERGEKIDLGSALIFYFYGAANNKVIQPDTTEGKKLYEKYQKGGSYIRKADMNAFIKEKFCSDIEGVTLKGIESFLLKEEQVYFVPAVGRESVEAPLVLKYEKTENQIFVEFSFVYIYAGEDVVFDNQNDELGVYQNEKIVINKDKLSKLNRIKMIFCTQQDRIKLQSIKLI